MYQEEFVKYKQNCDTPRKDTPDSSLFAKYVTIYELFLNFDSSEKTQTLNRTLHSETETTVCNFYHLLSVFKFKKCFNLTANKMLINAILSVKSHWWKQTAEMIFY